MEYYFSGTIERVIFENQSSFFRILLLDINDTDAEDYEDFEILSLERWQILLKEKIIASGENCPSSKIRSTIANESLWTGQTNQQRLG